MSWLDLVSEFCNLFPNKNLRSHTLYDWDASEAVCILERLFCEGLDSGRYWSWIRIYVEVNKQMWGSNPPRI